MFSNQTVLAVTKISIHGKQIFTESESFIPRVTRVDSVHHFLRADAS